MNTEGLLKKLHGNPLQWTLPTTYMYIKRVLMDLPYNRVGSTPTRHHMLVNRNPSARNWQATSQWDPIDRQALQAITNTYFFLTFSIRLLLF